MEYKRINFTHKDLMAFQNSIRLTDEEKFIFLLAQLVEFNKTDGKIFTNLYSIAKDGFKFDDPKIRRIETSVLDEKARMRGALFESTIDKNLYGKYAVWKTQLTNREKYIIFSFCLTELVHALDKSTISHFENQIQGILKISREDHKKIHVDLNKLNYICQKFKTLFK